MSNHFHSDSSFGAETGLQPVVYVISFITSFFCVTYCIVLCMLGCHGAPSFPPPTLIDYIFPVSICLSDHAPRVTLPCFSVAELHGFLHVSDVCCLIPLLTPPCPPTGGVRDRLQHKPTDHVTGEYQRSFECSTVAFKVLNPAESLGLFFSLIHLLSLTTVRHNLRQRAPLCGHNATNNYTSLRLNKVPSKHSILVLCSYRFRKCRVYQNRVFVQFLKYFLSSI